MKRGLAYQGRELGHPVSIERVFRSVPWIGIEHGYLHMPTECDLEISQPSFGVCVTESADTVNNEAVISYRCLEALQAIP